MLASSLTREKEGRSLSLTCSADGHEICWRLQPEAAPAAAAHGVKLLRRQRVQSPHREQALPHLRLGPARLPHGPGHPAMHLRAAPRSHAPAASPAALHRCTRSPDCSIPPDLHPTTARPARLTQHRCPAVCPGQVGGSAPPVRRAPGARGLGAGRLHVPASRDELGRDAAPPAIPPQGRFERCRPL